MVVLSIPLQMSLLATNESPNIPWRMAAGNEPANAPVVEQARQPGKHPGRSMRFGFGARALLAR
jgi:hypothetical protein